jgi:purine-binding chemotaxis protein CheW
MNSYLRLRLKGQFFALPLSVVEEILLLPELTCIPDAPMDVLGVVNWRGKTLPVIHLAKRLGISQPQCYITDNLIVINYENLIVGIVVNQVEDTIEIDEGQIDQVFQQFQPPISLFLQGVVPLNGTLIPLIDPAHLVRSPSAVAQLLETDIDTIEGANLEDFYTRFVGDISPKEQAIFQQRRLDLLTANNAVVEGQKIPFALVEIGQETIGIPLDQIQEFINISDPVPIPFSPEFLIGNISLRGEILTLIDIAPLLGLSSQYSDEKHALVFQWEQNKFGISISQVLDMVDVDKLNLSANNYQNKPGIIGTAVVGEKPTTFLDLKEIICNALMDKGGGNGNEN